MQVQRLFVDVVVVGEVNCKDLGLQIAKCCPGTLGGESHIAEVHIPSSERGKRSKVNEFLWRVDVQVEEKPREVQGYQTLRRVRSDLGPLVKSMHDAMPCEDCLVIPLEVLKKVESVYLARSCHL